MLVHETGALIIDLGMCLRVPFDEPLSTSMQMMTMNKRGVAVANPNDVHVNGRTKIRHLIQPQGTCGKWIYMSPEIHKNEAFDGYAVDMWAAGVILFLMLTGFPPWERACATD
jgi:serine/threonine protein kinase